MKIVLPDSKTITRGAISLDAFEAFGDVVRYELSEYDQLKERLAGADVIFCNKTLLNAETLELAPNLKYIGLFATGCNNVDFDYTNSHNITVCNAGSYSTEAVAQHTFALILNHYNQVGNYDAYVRSGEYKKADTFSPFVFPMGELMGKTIGLVGYGCIGSKVAEIAKAFDMEVLVYARRKKEGVQQVDLPELLRRSDIVSVHCPLNEDSYHMFRAETFAMCKDGAFFVNTARGPIVEEKALLDAVKSGKLSGAGLDVLEKEPMTEDNILFNVQGITITPHVAWAPVVTRERLLGIVLDNYKAFLEGNPKNVVTHS